MVDNNNNKKPTPPLQPNTRDQLDAEYRRQIEYYLSRQNGHKKSNNK